MLEEGFESYRVWRFLEHIKLDAAKCRNECIPISARLHCVATSWRTNNFSLVRNVTIVAQVAHRGTTSLNLSWSDDPCSLYKLNNQRSHLRVQLIVHLKWRRMRCLFYISLPERLSVRIYLETQRFFIKLLRTLTEIFEHKKRITKMSLCEIYTREPVCFNLSQGLLTDSWNIPKRHDWVVPSKLWMFFALCCYCFYMLLFCKSVVEADRAIARSEGVWRCNLY